MLAALTGRKDQAAAAAAVLRAAGIDDAGMSLPERRESAAAVVERQMLRDAAAVEQHNAAQRQRAKRQRVFTDRMGAGGCFSKRRKLAEWQRAQQAREEPPAAPAPIDEDERMHKYRRAERKLGKLEEERDSLQSGYGAFRERRAMTLRGVLPGDVNGVAPKERELLRMLEQAEQDVEIQRARLRKYAPAARAAPVEEPPTPLRLTDADLGDMFPQMSTGGIASLSTRHYRKLLNGCAGRPADHVARGLRPYHQQLNNFIAQGAAWPSDTVTGNPWSLGTEIVPGEAPVYSACMPCRAGVGGGRLRLQGSGTLRAQTLQPRDREATLARYRQGYERDQRRSDARRGEQEPSAERLAESHRRIAVMPAREAQPRPRVRAPPPTAEHVCDGSCICDLVDEPCECGMCKAKVRGRVTGKVVGMRRGRFVM